jgi:DNA-binding NarL/FixJ family response regulator
MGALRKVLVADNQALMIAGISQFLSEIDDLTVVGFPKDSTEFKQLLANHKPELLIIDYNLPDYLSLQDIESGLKISPGSNILIISSDNNKSTILNSLQLGVKGFVTKSCSRDEIFMAINSVIKGEKFYCHKILNIIIEKHFPSEASVSEVGILTPRERQILAKLAKGGSTQKISDELHLSPHTVQTHRKSIIKKLNISSPTEFVIKALDFGLLKL